MQEQMKALAEKLGPKPSGKKSTASDAARVLLERGLAKEREGRCETPPPK